MERAIPAEILEKRIQELDRKVDELRRLMREAQQEKTWVRRMLSQAVSLAESPSSVEPAGDENRTPGGGVGLPEIPTTERVVRFVHDHPGARPVDVVDHFEERIVSESKNKRKMLYTVIGNLQRKGRLLTRNGKLYEPSDNGKQEGENTGQAR